MALCVILNASLHGARAADIRTVVLSGPPYPGASVGLYSPPALNDADQTAFETGGLWSEGSGALAQVVVPRGIFPNPPLLNNAGQVAFVTGSGEVYDTSADIWSQGHGSLALVARKGSRAPGTPNGRLFGSLGFPWYSWTNAGRPLIAFNDAGHTAFWARLTFSGANPNGNNGEGIWSDRSGSLQPVAVSGNPAPGAPPGANFGQMDSPALNSKGRIAFSGLLVGSGLNYYNNAGLWSDASGALALVVRGGTQAPGAALGVNFSSIGAPVLNDGGQIAFSANLAGVGVDSSNMFGIWSDASGSMALVARSGNQAPGAPSGVTFGRVGWPLINNIGQAAFYSPLAGDGVTTANNESIWIERHGALTLVVREGSSAPGAPTGVNFASLDSNSLALNDAGQLAFMAQLTDNSSSLWATDVAGGLHLIARKGGQLEVAPGDFRTVNALAFAGGAGTSDGRRLGFNNSGQLAFSAAFTGGSSGIFVSNRVAVPEPSALTLSATTLGLCLARRPRRCR
jgi:hypothetical protein